MENFEMEWKNIVRTIKINATVEERDKIEKLKKLLKETGEEKSKYAKEVSFLREKVLRLENRYAELHNQLWFPN
jgi:polyhydroxyalkanoate synthesis regulator phasin